ncbi:MAG: hypothetical protein IKI64_04215 [Clostridia bacterium]|nr:hypothetical protein [Clostridia bacterium]
MDIIGKWRVCAMRRMGENGLEWAPAETLLEEAKAEQDKDSIMLLNALYVFEPDGRVITAMKLPEGVSREEIEQAVAAGQIELYGEDRFTTGETQEWKLEDGKLMYDTGISGEVLGEPVSSWVEIEEVDGAIELPLMRLIRAE